MTRIISKDDMTTVRQSLADAGIYFDKLYINQAYFNSNFTINASSDTKKKSKTSFWHKLLCGKDGKKSSTGTQTALTVRDDSELKPTPVIRRHRTPHPENVYDRRRYRPVNGEHLRNNYQQPIRRRRSSLATRSTQMQRPKQINSPATADDDDDEFAV